MDRREDVVCMMRVRDEARWIRASLERTFEVAKTIVLFDDGSEDETVKEALAATGAQNYDPPRGVFVIRAVSRPSAHLRYVVLESDTLEPTKMEPGVASELHVIRSPFRPAEARPAMAVNEVRDKDVLWEYCKTNVRFRHVLCIDGDEILSRRFVRDFGKVLAAFEDKVDVAAVPFVYLWDSDTQARIDGIYGNLPDGHRRLRFNRLFTIVRVPPAQLQRMRFDWKEAGGGFHCGSVPMAGFRVSSPLGELRDPIAGFYGGPVIHLGYRDREDRERKFKWYNQHDPNNTWEGGYKHIIGEPDVHAPGPVQLEPWSDAP